MGKQQQLIVENFKYGVDRRRSYLTSVPGTLYTLNNAHITQGASIEKRKAFVRLVNSDGALATSLVAGTFGLQRTATGLLVFGSIADPIGVTLSGVTYLRLRHPSDPSGAGTGALYAMYAVVWSELFNGDSWVIASYGTSGSNGTFAFYNGTPVYDITNGLVLPALSTKALIVAELVAEYVRQGRYTASVIAPVATLSAGRTGNVVTIITAVAHGLTSGQTVTVTGLTGDATLNASDKIATVVNATTFTYPQTGGNSGPAGDGNGTVSNNILLVDGPIGVDYVMSASKTLVAGSLGAFLGPSNTRALVVPKVGIASTGSFRVQGGTPGAVGGSDHTVSSIKVYNTQVAAVASLTTNGTVPALASTVTIGTKTYTFVAGAAADYQVTRGATGLTALANLKNAVNLTQPAVGYVTGTMVANNLAFAKPLSGSVLPLTAITPGAAGNAIVLSQTGTTNLTISAFASGAGTYVELLLAPVYYIVDNANTVNSLVTAINLNSGTSGYTALANDNQVQIFSSASASPMPSNFKVSVTATGDVCIGALMFYLTIPSSTTLVPTPTIETILVGGTDILGGVQSVFPTDGATLELFYQSMANKINAGTATHGILMYAAPTFMILSKAVTTSSDQPLAVYIKSSATVANTNDFGVVFGQVPNENPPTLVSTIPDGLNDAVVLSGTVTNVPGGAFYSGTFAGTTVLTAVQTGGSPATNLSRYHWRPEVENAAYPGKIAFGSAGPLFQNDIFMGVVSASTQSTLFTLSPALVKGKTFSGNWVCEITDGNGVVVQSNACTVVLTTI